MREGLHELARKELVRPARNSSMEGQQEYSFWHGLVRDVAYDQIPRAARGGKHEAVAKWLEEVAGDRVPDHAEVLVHHYGEALELARASGQHHDVGRLETSFCRFLSMAGDRALNLDAPRAYSYFQRALRFIPSGQSDRGKVLLKVGTAAQTLNQLDEAQQAFREGLDELHHHGDMILVGETKLRLSAIAWAKGNTKQSAALSTEALEVLEQQPPGPELAAAYSIAANGHGFAGHFEDALEWAQKALRLAEQVDSGREIAGALSERGWARCELGDIGSLADIRESLTMSLQQGITEDVMFVFSALGSLTHIAEGPRPALEIHEAGIRHGLQRGDLGGRTWLRAETTWMRFDLGDWDRLLADVAEVVAEAESGGHRQMTATVLPCQAHVLALQARSSEAVSLEQRYLPSARDIGDLQVLVPALTIAAVVRAGIGDPIGVSELGREFAQTTGGHLGWRARHLPKIVRALVASRELESATKNLVNESEVGMARDRHSAVTAQAIVSEARGRIEEARHLYQDTAQRWADYGFVLEEGQAFLGLARCLIALGDRETATEPLQKARSIFERLGAALLLNEVDGYLGDLKAASG